MRQPGALPSLLYTSLPGREYPVQPKGFLSAEPPAHEHKRTGRPVPHLGRTEPRTGLPAKAGRAVEA